MKCSTITIQGYLSSVQSAIALQVIMTKDLGYDNVDIS
jgi:hypothetical protein